MQALCTNEADYNSYTPTKQNILCNGKSALQTILENEDFEHQNGNKSETLGIQVPPPQFSYTIKKKTLSIILVLDVSQKMASKWTSTRDALFRLVSHMPSGSGNLLSTIQIPINHIQFSIIDFITILNTI